MSVRIRQVLAGHYQVGDRLDGYRITGFGRTWRLDYEESSSWGVAPWEQPEVCYAYGEPEADVAAPAPAPVPKPAPPAYGSREWKVRRVAQLEDLIAKDEWTAHMNRASANRDHREAGRRAAESAVTLRAEMERLTAELAD